MASINVGGKDIPLDEEGYLENLSDWTPEVAEVLASGEDVTLTSEHWEILNFLREYYEEYQIAPAVRVLTKAVGKRTKSGILVGLGETPEEVYKTMDDLIAHGCDVLTIGQYLQPTKMHLEVAEYIFPDLFKHYQEVGMNKGFDFVESGPLVRSSYHAERHL